MAPKTNRKVRLVLAWTYDADHAAAKSGKWTAKDDGTLWFGAEFVGWYTRPRAKAEQLERIRDLDHYPSQWVRFRAN